MFSLSSARSPPAYSSLFSMATSRASRAANQTTDRCRPPLQIKCNVCLRCSNRNARNAQDGSSEFRSQWPKQSSSERHRLPILQSPVLELAPGVKIGVRPFPYSLRQFWPWAYELLLISQRLKKPVWSVGCSLLWLGHPARLLSCSTVPPRAEGATRPG
ncbi:hypothetical protein N658DRAFT_117760 [Parathielavia hyrcaniae]|uniref:Uncharacterized protein n=1 Tax=Parathielavia hyrcaniae TaxID=113614 RepID=A0AAN6QDB1_9PEZI|nr:hypothetical protein N658DRAFT_117760 [Parathielavia hyrcaniae]